MSMTVDHRPRRQPADDDDWRRHYANVRELETGELAGLSLMIVTVGLVVGLEESGYRGRYCYERYEDAKAALEAWDGEGDPSGPWIKYKGRGGERLGPGAVPPLPGSNGSRD